MAYIQPQLRIFQQFEAVLSTGVTPLYACIIGPQYGLHTGDDCESLGDYDRTKSNTYSWPGKSAGSTVELDTAVLNFQDAVMRYYAGSAFSVPAGAAAGGNKIKAPGLVLRTANGYTRSAIFGTRDVAIGDKVRVAWDGEVLETQIAGFEADEINTIGSATAAASNQTNTIAIAPTVDSQTIADHELLCTAGGSYDGLAEGVLSETYTVTVTSAGGSGVAEAQVVSTSGTDDVSVVVIDYTSTNIGTRGVTCALVDTGSSSSSLGDSSSSNSSSQSLSSITESLSSNSESNSSVSNSSVTNSSSSNSSSSYNDYKDLQVGDTWTISAQQAFTAPSPTSGGSYSGSSDTTYIFRIVSGGVVGVDDIVYAVTTDNGYDVQSNTVVSAAGAVLVGNYGVTLTLTAGAQYAGGDVWTIDVLASNEGAIRTILLADKLDVNGNKADDTDALTTWLSLVGTVECPSVYYTKTASSITVLPNVKVTGTYLGSSQQFPVLEADMCVEYRELLIDNTTSIGSIEDLTDVEDTLGTISTQNPLAKGVYSALLNCNGTTVYYVATASDDLSGYSDALDVLSTNDDVYSLVPLNNEQAIIDLFEAHVDEQSAPTRNNWRIAWVNSDAEQQTAVYTELSTGANIEATITDPAGGSNYVEVTAADALFVTNGVQAGDIVRFNYRPYAGQTVYDTAVIDTVDTETELTLLTSVSQAYPVPIKIEIYRTLTMSQFATAIGQSSSSIKNRRMYNIWPDRISDGTSEVSGVYLCCALAGLRAGVAPHAPLTNVEITGFGSPTRTLMFNNTQLNTMAEAGTWIVTSDLSGTVYTRHQVSTDNTDVNRREQTITTNLDSISRIFRDAFSDLIGRGNVSQDMVDIIRTRTHSTAEYIQGFDYPLSLGPQLQDYEILELAIDPVLRDHITLRIQPGLPYPLNNLDIIMYIS